MPSAFTSLPFDVLLAICQEVDALSNRGIHKSAILSRRHRVGHRVVANVDIVPDSLLALAAVNKRVRDASEPLIFGTIKFGSRWEARGEIRWAIAKSRMRGMIQKRSLRRTVKSLVWDCSSAAPWDSINQSRPQFWTLFAKLMRHLDHVESVELGFWSEQLSPYPASWRDSLLHGAPRPAQEEQLLRLHQPRKPKQVQILLSCMPCIPSAALMDDENETLGDLAVGVPLQFPNIKSARLRRGSQWFADHCPNLAHFIDAGYVKKWDLLDLVALGRRCPRVQTLDTLLVASPDVILVVLTHFPLLEKLVVLAPAAHSGGRQLQDMAPLLAEAGTLRSLEFSRPSFKGLFPQKGEQFRNLLDTTAAAFSEHSSSLSVLKLGEFTYSRISSDEPLRMKQLQSDGKCA